MPDETFLFFFFCTLCYFPFGFTAGEGVLYKVDLSSLINGKAELFFKINNLEF